MRETRPDRILIPTRGEAMPRLIRTRETSRLPSDLPSAVNLSPDKIHLDESPRPDRRRKRFEFPKTPRHSWLIFSDLNQA
jgi:hypothetical protein